MTDEPNIRTADPAEAPEPAPLPLLRAEAINAGPMLAQLAAQQDVWTGKFDDGDITAKEFRAGLNAIEERKDAIKWEQKKAALAEEMAEGQRFNQWAGAVKDFMETTGKQIAANRPLLVAFDAEVRKAHGDPANRGLSDRAILAKAHRKFRDDLDTSIGRSDSTVGGADLASLNKLGPIELEDALLNMTPQEREDYLR